MNKKFTILIRIRIRILLVLWVNIETTAIDLYERCRYGEFTNTWFSIQVAIHIYIYMAMGIWKMISTSKTKNTIKKKSVSQIMENCREISHICNATKCFPNPVKGVFLNHIQNISYPSDGFIFIVSFPFLFFSLLKHKFLSCSTLVLSYTYIYFHTFTIVLDPKKRQKQNWHLLNLNLN